MSDGLREGLEVRVEALSPTQRSALARMITELKGRPGRRQLTAYLELRDSGLDQGALRDFLAARLPEHMIPTRYVVLDRLPRNRADKLDRRAVVFLTGSELGDGPADVVAPRSEIEETLTRIWRDVLGIDEISVHDDFLEIGGDSLLSIRVLSRAGREGIRISPQDFFAAPTIAGLAALHGEAGAPAEQGAVVGTAPITPIQHWFFERITRHRHHWNQAVLLEVPTRADQARIRGAIGALVHHHDALRTRFLGSESGWWQEVLPTPDDPPLRTVDLSATPEADCGRRIRKEADAEHSSLDLGAGRLFRAVFFDGGSDFRRLLLVAHHLIIDAVSWGILLDDLSKLLSTDDEPSARDLPRKTASVLTWAKALTAAAATSEVTELLSLWTPRDAPGPATTSVGGPPASGEPGTTEAGRLRVELDEAGTAELVEHTGTRTGVSTQARILASVLLGWCRWSGRSELLVDVEGHGRDALPGGPDVSRTVGWFTTVFPLPLRIREVSATECVRAVLEAFQRLDLRGGSHGLLRFLHPDPGVRRSLAERPPSELLFNYLGTGALQLPPDSPLHLASEPTGLARPLDASQVYPVEINVTLESGCLCLDVTFDSSVHTARDVERLGEALRAALAEVGRAPASVAATFELSGLDERGLEKVADLLAGIDEG